MNTKLSPSRPTGFITNGNMWGHPHSCDAIGPDGIVRRVRLNQQADTFFSWPGRVSYKGKTVRCLVTCDDGIHRFTVTGKGA